MIVVSFIGGGHRSTPRKPLTCRKSLSDKFDVIAESIDCDPEYDVSYGVGFVKY